MELVLLKTLGYIMYSIVITYSTENEFNRKLRIKNTVCLFCDNVLFIGLVNHVKYMVLIERINKSEGWYSRCSIVSSV